ncbi:MAG: ATP-binding cassette domain-containing protein [Rickettsiaceae bacterium]|nr:ATP-binding cassette domain-containing protein [Rickettsiaceae bacterium]
MTLKMRRNKKNSDILIKFKQDNIDNERIKTLMELFERYQKITPLAIDNLYISAMLMLLNAFDWSGNIKNALYSLPLRKKTDIDLVDICDSMADLGYISHEMQIDINDIDPRLMPCLYIIKGPINKVLVLLNRQEQHIVAFDAEVKALVHIEAKQYDAGTAYFFEKINSHQLEEEIQAKKSIGFSWFAIIFSRFRPIINKVILASIFINIFALSMPLFITSIYDWVIDTRAVDTLLIIMIGISVAFGAESALRIYRLRALVWLGARLDNIISTAIFERLVFTKAHNTETIPIAAQIARLRSFESIRQFFTGSLFGVMIELPFTVILLAAIWFIAGPLFLIPVSVALLFILFLIIIYSSWVVSIKESANSGSIKNQHEVETLIKIDALHINGIANNWWSRYKDKLSDAVTSKFQMMFISSIVENFTRAIVLMCGVAVMTFGVHLVWKGSITVGALVATILLIWRIVGPMQILTLALPRFIQLKDSISQINQLMNTELETQPLMTSKPIYKMEGHVKLSAIGLRYSRDTEPLLFGLDLNTKPGEIIAITGANGSGKSSLLKLLNGLYHPQTGVVTIDGTNIKQLDPIELRSYISYMPQLPNFFEGTIKENISLMNPFITSEGLNLALKNADALDDINKLDNGIETIIGSEFEPLDSDLMYKLNFARVLVRNSNLILLDELPNYLLNDKLGKLYMQMIKDCKQSKKTVFFISQRKEYLEYADKIIVLTLGKQPLIIEKNQSQNKPNSKK